MKPDNLNQPIDLQLVNPKVQNQHNHSYQVDLEETKFANNVTQMIFVVGVSSILLFLLFDSVLPFKMGLLFLFTVIPVYWMYERRQTGKTRK